MNLLNLANANTATTGTGTMTLGSALTGYMTWSAAGAVNGRSYPYLITDGSAWELGTGVYSSGTLTRTLIASSTSALLNLSGSAMVACVARVNDIWVPPITKLWLASNLSMPASVWTTVTWDTVGADDVGAAPSVPGTTITTPAGFTRCRVSAYLAWQNAGAGVRYGAILQNGTGVRAGIIPVNNESPLHMQTMWRNTTAGDLWTVQGIPGTTTENLSGTGFTGPSEFQIEWAP